MQFLKAVLISPHPPVLIEDIGHGGEAGAAATLRGLTKISHIISGIRPKVILYISPHGNMFADAISIVSNEKIKGDMRRFGAAKISYEKTTNAALLDAIQTEFDVSGIPYVLLNQESAKKYNISVQLDHGVIVPMYFIDKAYSDYEILHITPGDLSLKEMYLAGKAAYRAIDKTGLITAVVASGDLSHYLKEDGPYGYRREGELLDAEIVRVFKEENLTDILRINPKLIEKGGECGLKGFAFALGMTDGMDTTISVYSYEAPFGVGYMTASLLPTGDKVLSNFSVKKRSYSDPYIKLAQAAIEKYVRDGVQLNWDDYQRMCDTAFVSKIESTRAGAFVSIHKNEALRGCIGTISPTCENLAQEIIYCAIEAASQDPRFYPISKAELDFLDIKVDILEPAEDIADKSLLDEKRYGVIVSKGTRRGLLLPNLDGVESVDEQLRIARQKAGIDEREEGVRLKRFEVIRHEEK